MEFRYVWTDGNDAAFQHFYRITEDYYNALANHVCFPECGCELIGLFDSNPFITGKDIEGMQVHHTDTLPSFCHRNIRSLQFCAYLITLFRVLRSS